MHIASERHWNVAAVGCGCVLIHRTVLETVERKHAASPWPWFEYTPWTNPDGKPDQIGEDYSFCFKAGALGFSSWVDTTIHVGHLKTVNITTSHFWRQFPSFEGVPAKTFAVIPVKDKLGLTKNLLRKLHAQGGYDQLFVIDNGSGPETQRWLKQQTFATVFPMPGAGIHEMWNAGIGACLSQWPMANIALLNNDLEPGPDMLATLARDLRDNDLWAVCPNYDGRPGEGVELVNGICANRYDGTGGLAGFAMMVRGELFGAGYRFPEECKWWYGDNDLTLALDAQGFAYGISHNTTVEHLDGGGATGVWDDPAMQAQLAQDRDRFLKRWSAA
jgi:GT2 family glycosyltransferase